MEAWQIKNQEKQEPRKLLKDSVRVLRVSRCAVCAQAEEKEQREQQDDGDEPRPSVVGVPGLTAKSDWKPPPETQQEVIDFQKSQAEERKVRKSKQKKAEAVLPIKWQLLLILRVLVLRAPPRGWR